MKNAFYLISGRPWQASAHSNSGIFMPRLSIRTVMLEELVVHSQSIWQRRFQQRINDALSDLSESDISDSSQLLSSFGSPISIDTPDIMISSDILMSSDHSSTDSSDSEISITDFEVEYYQNWRCQYRELVDHISTVCVLISAPPMPKWSQLCLLDHWKVHCPDWFHCKLRVDPETFDSLVRLIIDNPIFYNNSNCPQFPVPLQLYIFLFRAGHYGNAASPEDTAQWAGMSVGGVEKCTDHIVVALLSYHDQAIHFPETDEKEDAMDYIGEQTCPEWCKGFLLADGTKFSFFQCPGLHSDA
jgi:hypothetical protein